jgi:hypothetical protein
MSQQSKRASNQLRRVARLLGWRSPIRRYQHRVREKEAPPKLQGTTLTWFEVGTATGGRHDCFLHINESPPGQTITYIGAVYAIRYRICTGWHKFRLFADADDFEREALRLREWLAWEWFASPEKRRVFRRAHPMSTGYSWRAIRERGLPKPNEDIGHSAAITESPLPGKE